MCNGIQNEQGFHFGMLLSDAAASHRIKPEIKSLSLTIPQSDNPISDGQSRASQYAVYAEPT